MAPRPMKTTIALNRTDELEGGLLALFGFVAMLEDVDSIKPREVRLAGPRNWRRPDGELNIA
jgi:hypothetical protein